MRQERSWHGDVLGRREERGHRSCRRRAIAVEKIWPAVGAVENHRFLVNGADTFQVSPSHGLPALYVAVLSQSQRANPPGFMQQVLCHRPRNVPLGTSKLMLTLRLEASVVVKPLRIEFQADNQGRLRPKPVETPAAT